MFLVKLVLSFFYSYLPCKVNCRTGLSDITRYYSLSLIQLPAPLALGNKNYSRGGEGPIARPKTEEPTLAKNTVNCFETSNYTLGRTLDNF